MTVCTCMHQYMYEPTYAYKTEGCVTCAYLPVWSVYEQRAELRPYKTLLLALTRITPCETFNRKPLQAPTKSSDSLQPFHEHLLVLEKHWSVSFRTWSLTRVLRIAIANTSKTPSKTFAGSYEQPTRVPLWKFQTLSSKLNKPSHSLKALNKRNACYTLNPSNVYPITYLTPT